MSDYREHFDILLKAWHDIAKQSDTMLKDTDFKYIVTYDTSSFCHDGKYGNSFVEPKWILEHCSTLEDQSFWRMYFDTPDELYKWGCERLAKQINVLKNA